MSTNSKILKGRAFRQEEGVAEALREQADRPHLEENLALQKQSAADEARARTKEDGAARRGEAQEELDAEPEQLRLEKTETKVATEEAKQKLEMAEAKEKVGTERTIFFCFVFRYWETEKTAKHYFCLLGENLARTTFIFWFGSVDDVLLLYRLIIINFATLLKFDDQNSCVWASTVQWGQRTRFGVCMCEFIWKSRCSSSTLMT